MLFNVIIWLLDKSLLMLMLTLIVEQNIENFIVWTSSFEFRALVSFILVFFLVVGSKLQNGNEICLNNGSGSFIVVDMT